MLTMDQVDMAGRRVVVREDLNVPLADGEVADDSRIRAALPTLRAALDAGAAVIVVSHLGRPTEGEFDPELSLHPVATALSAALDKPVPLVASWGNGIDIAPGEIAMLENIRFERGEKANDPELSRRLAGLGDIFVHDAFATAHRAQASTHGAVKHARVACAGPLLAAEIEALDNALESPRRPLVAVVGGSKVSTKLKVLESLSGLVDTLVVGGGIANTFLAAVGKPVGKSLCEFDQLDIARELMQSTAQRGGSIPLPVDVVTSHAIDAAAPAVVKPVEDVAEDDLILDLGPGSLATIAEAVDAAGTILWNGPLGLFEMEQFGAGTQALARSIAASDGFSVAGGGDTLAAIAKYDVADGIDYISTGGGAFLEFIENRTLPAIDVLREQSTQ